MVEHELIIFVPGAYISTPGPVSDDVAFWSNVVLNATLSELPTLIASSSCGDEPL